MPMKLRLELGAMISLDDVDAEREPAHDFVEKASGRPLVARVEHLQDADPRAVIDRRELIQPLASAGDSLEELHVHLQAMAGLGLLVALPALLVRPVLLIRG